MIICTILEICLFVFAIYHICLPLKKKDRSPKTIPILFQCLIFGYHISAISLYALVITTYIPVLFNTGSVYDFTSLFTCNIARFWALLPFSGIYPASILFWFFRLVKIFNGTIYGVSVKFQRICILIFVIIVILSTACTFGGIIVSYRNDNGNWTSDNSQTFCREKYNVVDFLPILQESNKISYNYKINNFYTCDVKSDHLSSYLLVLSSLLTILSVPVMNGYLFYQFVKRMSQLIKNISTRKNSNAQKNSKTDQFEDAQLYYIYLNCVIGILSVSTTLLSLVLYIVDRGAFLSAIFIDVVINGYFMLLVYHFGNKILPKCCDSTILGFVKKKKESELKPSTPVMSVTD